MALGFAALSANLRGFVEVGLIPDPIREKPNSGMALGFAALSANLPARAKAPPHKKVCCD
jgi:hypothetical protein